MTTESKISWLALALAALALSSVIFLARDLPNKHTETAYERVARTMLLRCGYMVVPPFVSVDPNTKALGGMNILYVERMTKLLGLSLTWTEILPGQQAEAMRANKIDAVCGGEAPLVAESSTYLHYTAPLVYSPLYLYVREGDMRFDGTRKEVFAKLNQPDLKVAVMDADVTLDFAARLFPQTEKHALPASADYAQLYMDVADGKADFVIDDPFTAGDFMAHNPGRLRQVALDAPIAVLPNNFSVLRGQEALADLLSQGVASMQSRELDQDILDAFEHAHPGTLFRTAPGYTLPAPAPTAH